LPQGYTNPCKTCPTTGGSVDKKSPLSPKEELKIAHRSLKAANNNQNNTSAAYELPSDFGRRNAK